MDISFKSYLAIINWLRERKSDNKSLPKCFDLLPEEFWIHINESPQLVDFFWHRITPTYFAYRPPIEWWVEWQEGQKPAYKETIQEAIKEKLKEFGEAEAAEKLETKKARIAEAKRKRTIKKRFIKSYRLLVLAGLQNPYHYGLIENIGYRNLRERKR